MEGKCKQIHKGSQGKEHSYVYFVLRTTVDKIKKLETDQHKII